MASRCSAVPRSCGPPRPYDRALGFARPRSRRPRPDCPALRHGHGRRDHGTLAADRAESGIGRRAPYVEARAGSANLAEAQAFMDDEKRILVFSDAGGTGRSYHADLAAKNRRPRVHYYLLEAGWKADAAIQGLGRSNRTNQAQPPLFRPIATNVKAEKQFLSTIARRLDTLRRHHPGPAPDRRARPVPRRRRSQIRLCPCGATPALPLTLYREGRGLLAIGVRGRNGAAAHRQRRQLARGSAAHHHLSQSPPRADDRPPEHPVRRVR